jgi:nucleoside phosphorylase
VAAFGPELAPLVPLLGEGLRARVGGLDVAARPVGIGLAAAAAGAALHVADLAPRGVVLLGTCGAYLRPQGPDASGAALAIGDVAVPERLRLTSPCLVDGVAELPAPMSVELFADGTLTDGLLRAGGVRADVATTLGITVDDAAADRLSRAAEARAEHLEAYGVATACAARGVPFAAALGVANFVGASARHEWRTHHHAASAAAVGVIIRWLQVPFRVGA